MLHRKNNAIAIECILFRLHILGHHITVMMDDRVLLFSLFKMSLKK
jgi:hypothetical protein